ncbi:MAG: NAD(P)/FAD-dependent oxidoreductase [Eubacterium sp.]|jgi:thioredoxin reductase (NADPH)|nr:NAD(P)/FAD-dependent oxidoreductase [Eubacterium sp.]MDO5804070.1 NAD(P)/FAD-dependent oxidoreductase [Clostridia bacterium]
MERYDIAIIGTGPAGLSAAITAKIRNKKILLIGNPNFSDKVQKAHQIQNYLGLPAISGKDLAKAFENHINSMDITITEGKVNAVYPMGSYFGLQVSQDIYEAETVIVATGIVTGKAFKGENELLGRGVSYCATCDAPLYRNKTVAVIGYSPKEESEAEFLAEVCEKVLYIPMYKEETKLSDKVTIINEKPTAVIGENKVKSLQTEKNNYEVDGIFILRDSIPPSQLVSGLEIKDNHIVVNLQMETNIKGCFACGDIVGRPYQYIKAAGQGNIAGLSAVAYLDAKRKAMGEN